MIINIKETLADTISGKKILAAYAENSYTKTETDEILNTLGGIEVVPLDPSTEEPIVEKPNEKMLYLTENEEGETYSQWIYKNSTWTKLKLYAEDVKYDDENITPTDIEDTVAIVNELKENFETKITTNFPPAQITKTFDNIDNYPGYQVSDGGYLIGSLFNVPFKHPIKIDETLLGVYCSKATAGKAKCILGIYEYQPFYKRIDPTTHEVTGYGRTVSLCDTGIINLTTGFNEYPIKHLNKTIGAVNEETSPELKTDCLYYSTIYLSYGNAADSNPFKLMSAPGYDQNTNNIKPQIVIRNADAVKISASLFEGQPEYKEDLCFDDFGFTWCLNNYPTPTGENHYLTAEAPKEVPSADRFYMQIRNDKHYIPPVPPPPPTGSKSYYVQVKPQNATNIIWYGLSANGSDIVNDIVTGWAGDWNMEFTNSTQGRPGDSNPYFYGGARFLLETPDTINTLNIECASENGGQFEMTVSSINDDIATEIGSLTGDSRNTYTINCS